MRKIIIICISLWIALAAQAQSERLDYYQHTKTVWANGNVETQSGNNGQFVHRTKINGGPRCYDATRSGLDHLNGMLSYIGTNNGNEVYKGTSYWGNGTIYQFDDERGYLNVKDSNGNVYVFKRTSAPAGRSQSSYLKKGASAEGWDAIAEWNKIHNPITNDDGSNSRSTPEKKNQTTNSNNNNTRRCGYCHGNKWVRAHVGVSGFGIDNTKKKCTTCGEWYLTSCDHWHACPYCK